MMLMISHVKLPAFGNPHTYVSAVNASHEAIFNMKCMNGLPFNNALCSQLNMNTTDELRISAITANNIENISLLTMALTIIINLILPILYYLIIKIYPLVNSLL